MDYKKFTDSYFKVTKKFIGQISYNHDMLKKFIFNKDYTFHVFYIEQAYDENEIKIWFNKKDYVLINKSDFNENLIGLSGFNIKESKILSFDEFSIR